MRALEFPASVLEQIDHDRFHHPCPQIQKRMEVLRLAAHGLPRTDIIRLSGLSRASVQRRLDEFRDGGLEAVKRWNYPGRTNALQKHAASLEDYFREHPPATVADAREVIGKKTGVRRGLTQVRQFLKTIGTALPQGPRRSRQGRSHRPEGLPRRHAPTPVKKGLGG